MLQCSIVSLCLFWFWSSHVIGPVVGLPDHMVAELLPLNPPPFCSHYWLLPVDIPPAARGYSSLKRLEHLLFRDFCLWSFWLLSGKSFCRLDLHVFINSWCWAFFHALSILWSKYKVFLCFWTKLSLVPLAPMTLGRGTLVGAHSILLNEVISLTAPHHHQHNQKVQTKMTGIIKLDKNMYNPWISFTAAEDVNSYKCFENI